jgi:predicted DNA-binding transcriptional regulator YafY
MVWSEARRFASVSRTLRVVARLLLGDELDRETVARIADVRPAAADRIIRAVKEHLGGFVEVGRVGKRRVLRHATVQRQKKLNISAAVAACFGSSLAGLFEGSNYAPGMREALNYVVLASAGKTRFRDLERKFVFARRGGEISLPERAGDLDEIVDAILERNHIRLKYTNFDGVVSDSEVQPLSIVIYDHQLYVIAKSPGRPLHPYRFSRVLEVDRRDSTFAYPSKAEYDPELLFRDCFGIHLGGDGKVSEVVVRLARRWTTYAQTHRWHDSQTVELRPDHVLVRLRVRVCPELISWVRSFGDEAEVVKPSTLRRFLAESPRRRTRATRRIGEPQDPSPDRRRTGDRRRIG